MTEFDRDHPLILGALLDAVAAGLRTEPTLDAAPLPRMADFAHFAESVCQGLGHAPVLSWRPIIATAARRPSRSWTTRPWPGHSASLPIAAPFWTGTASELLDELTALAGPRSLASKTWPKTPRGLSAIIRRLAPQLRATGVAITFGRDQHQRIVTVATVTRRVINPRGVHPEALDVPSLPIGGIMAQDVWALLSDADWVCRHPSTPGFADTHLLRVCRHPSTPGFADTHLLRVRRHPSTPGLQTPIYSGVRRHPSTPGLQTPIYSGVCRHPSTPGFAEIRRHPSTPVCRHPSTPGFAEADTVFADTHLLPIDSGVRTIYSGGPETRKSKVGRRTRSFSVRVLDTAGLFGTFVHYCYCGHTIRRECPPLFQESR